MIDDVPVFATAADRRRFEAALRARELLPAAALPTLVRARSAIGRRRRGRRDIAERNARVVLGDQASAEEVEALVGPLLLHAAWRQEAYRRPALLTHQEVDGVEHLRDALALGRGCVMSFFHHGDYIGSGPSLARLGVATESVGISDCFDPAADRNTKFAVHTMTSVPGSTLIDVAGGSRLIRERLVAGKAVMVAIDLAGHTPAHLFGRELHLSSGALRVAHELGSPVVVMTSRRPGRPLQAGTTVLSAPLDPLDHPEVETLHAEVVRRLEAGALAWPEAMHQPDRLLGQGITRSR
ncbi:lysophospholipid acyltransferase family protein [Nocardioides marmoraquaticus]